VGKMGLPAQRISADTTIPPGQNAVVINGNITSIDEGNRAKRVVIGFGAGASDVKASIRLDYLPGTAGEAAAEQQLAQFQANGTSGHAPGMAATAGAGAAIGAASTATTVAASGGTQVLRETQGATVSHDADDIGVKIADALK